MGHFGYFGSACGSNLPRGALCTGGVGEEEQAQLRALGSKFNLRVVTAQKPDGDYIAGAGVTIARGGQPLLQTSMPGPILYADLPPGAYRVRVTVEGQPQEQTVQLSAGETRNLVLHWRLPGS